MISCSSLTYDLHDLTCGRKSWVVIVIKVRPLSECKAWEAYVKKRDENGTTQNLWYCNGESESNLKYRNVIIEKLYRKTRGRVKKKKVFSL